jgi:hypothetical protein
MGNGKPKTKLHYIKYCFQIPQLIVGVNYELELQIMNFNSSLIIISLFFSLLLTTDFGITQLLIKQHIFNYGIYLNIYEL